MNEMLDQEFNRMEVNCALDQMNPNKALRLDGMKIMFYQKHWDIIEDNIFNVVNDSLNR